MTRNNDKKIFGFILTYNCASLLKNAYDQLPKDLFDKIICVDDGSSDDVVRVAESIGIPLFTHEHSGYGGNLKFALKKSIELGADYMVEIHGDGQYDPFSIKLAMSKFDQEYDLVLGNRFFRFTQPLKDGMSLIRYFGNFLLSLMARLVLVLGPPDLFTGFRAYSKHLVETLDFSRGSDDYFFSFEIIAQARYAKLKICHVPARCYYNKEHTSVNLWKGFLEIFQTPYVLILYLLARVGIKIGIFSHIPRENN